MFAVQSVKTDLLDCKVLYCSGFFLNTFGGPETVAELGESLLPNQIMATNLSAPFLAFAKKEDLDMCIGYSSLVVGNAEEASAWGEAHGLHNCSLEEIAARFAEISPLRKNIGEDEDSLWNIEIDGQVSRLAIITQGGDEIIVAISRMVV